MDFVHLHLMLNHFPIIGTMVGTGLFLSSFLLHGEGLRRSSLIVFVAVALLTITAFVTGAGAQVKVAPDAGISNALIRRHEGSAELAVWFMEITGALAVIGLWHAGRTGQPARWNTAALLVFSLVTVGLMARTGNTGGDIRHAEIRFSQPGSAEAALAHFEPSPVKFRDLIIGSNWRWAAIMGLHFVGLVMLIGTIGLLDLRVLGFAKELPIAPLNKLVPWGLAGFGINVLTGMLAFIGRPAFDYTYDIAFVLKMGAIVLAVATLGLFYLTGAFRDCQAVGPGEDAPLTAKLIAGASLTLWFAVIVLGRYIAPLQDTIAH